MGRKELVLINLAPGASTTCLLTGLLALVLPSRCAPSLQVELVLLASFSSCCLRGAVGEDAGYLALKHIRRAFCAWPGPPAQQHGNNGAVLDSAWGMGRGRHLPAPSPALPTNYTNSTATAPSAEAKC